MGQPCAPGSEPGHANVRDVLEGRHPEVGKHGTLLAEACDSRVGNLMVVVVVVDITFQAGKKIKIWSVCSLSFLLFFGPSIKALFWV